MSTIILLLAAVLLVGGAAVVWQELMPSGDDEHIPYVVDGVQIGADIGCGMFLLGVVLTVASLYLSFRERYEKPAEDEEMY